MAFMTPYYSNDPFSRIENQHGESRLVPTEYENDISADETIVERFTRKWFCHLSADGYLDQTEWEGPFYSEDDARDHIAAEHNVDPDTGDDLDETED